MQYPALMKTSDGRWAPENARLSFAREFIRARTSFKNVVADGGHSRARPITWWTSRVAKSPAREHHGGALHTKVQKRHGTLLTNQMRVAKAGRRLRLLRSKKMWVTLTVTGRLPNCAVIWRRRGGHRRAARRWAAACHGGGRVRSMLIETGDSLSIPANQDPQSGLPVVNARAAVPRCLKPKCREMVAGAWARERDVRTDAAIPAPNQRCQPTVPAAGNVCG